MKSTALTAIHSRLGARMVPFAGYHMPLQYAGINEEHLTVRSGVGVFDVSHMGEFIIKGAGALAFVQKMTTNDASLLAPGDAQYSCITNEGGGIIDDILVYRLEETKFLLVVNAANIVKDLQWLLRHTDAGVELEDISERTTLLAVQGPLAATALQPLTEINLGEMKYYSFNKGVFGGQQNVLVSATGYTGAGGFEIFCENSRAEALWNAIFEAGRLHGIKPVGLAARDTLRLEMGYCLYGNDIDEQTNPLEAGLGWITKFSKTFMGSDALRVKKEKGLSRKRVGIALTGNGIPRRGYALASGSGEPIGTVTSGTFSPSLKKGIAMGYVPAQYAKPGTELNVLIREKTLPANVVKMPFFKP